MGRGRLSQMGFGAGLRICEEMRGITVMCIMLGARRAASFALRGGGGGAALRRALPVRRMADDAAPEAPAFDFSAIDVRVGQFVEAWHHEDSEKLFCEKIDVGEDEPRQIVSGLRAYYELADLEARRVLVVCNLKKAKLGGVESTGMVLCGSDADGKVEFVEPPADAAIGERVMVEGMDGDALTPNQLKKKKAWEAVSPELKMVGGVATFRGQPIVTSAGACTTPTVVEGKIS